MKKILSLFCAIAIVFGVNAAPFKSHRQTVPSFEKARAERVVKAQAFRENPKTVTLKSLLKTKRVADAKRPVRRAHKADVSFEIKAENITQTTADVTVTPSDNEASYYFDLFAASEAKDLSDAEIVADLQDAWQQYAEYYGMELAEFMEYQLSNGEDSYTFKELNPGTEYTVVAFLVDEEFNLVGEVSRANFTTEAAIAPTGEKVNLGELTLDNFDDYRDADGSFILYLVNDTTEIALCIFDDDLDGVFTLEDLDLDWSYIYFENLGQPGIQSASISAVLSDDGKSSEFTVALIANNGVEYDFTAVVVLEEGGGEDPVDPVDPVDPTGGVLEIAVSEITKSSANVAVTPSVDGATFYWNVFAASDVAGLSDAEIGALFVQSMDDIIEYYSQYGYDISYADLMSEGADSYNFSGLNASTNYVVLAAYMDANANLQSEVFKGEFRTLDPPVAQDTILLSFAEPVVIEAYDEGDLYFVTAAENGYILQMDWYSNEIAGEFTQDDLYVRYCGLYAIADGDTTKIDFEDIALSIVENEDDYAITVTYLGSDLHCYIISAVCKKAVAERTVQVNLENASYENLGDYASYYGFTHYVVAAPADSSIVIVLAVAPENFVGNFTKADLNIAYSGVVDGQYAQVADAEFSVSEGENGSFILEGWVLANNNVKYEFVIKTAEQGGEEPVDPEEDSFTISVSDITSSSAVITVTPSKEGATFYWSLVKASEIEGLSDADIAKNIIVAEIEAGIEYYTEQGYTGLTIEDFLLDKEDSYTYKSLAAGTDYVVVAAYLDADGNLMSEVTKKEFKTADPADPSGATLSIAVSNIGETNATIVVTPSVEGATFYWSVVLASDIVGMSDADIAKNVIVAEMDDAIAYYGDMGYDLTYSDLLVDKEDSYTYSKLTAGTEYVVVAAYMDANGNLQGEVFKSEFSTSGGEHGADQGIENTNAVETATKRLVNGQILIEKNGKTYNVNGAIVK